MSILQQVPDKMQTILETVPDEAAVATGLVRRKRKLTGSALTQILVFGWLENPEASYQHLTETAATLGIEVRRQALEQRLTPETAEMLKLTLDATITEFLDIATHRQVIPLLEQFTGVYVQDSTWLTLPDELHETWKGHPKKNHPQKAALKLHLRFDVLTGGFQHFHLTDGMTADSTAAKTAPPLPEGSLHLADLAYFSLDELEKLTENGSYWISRLKVSNSYLADETGERLSLERCSRQKEKTPSSVRLFGSGKQSNFRFISSLKDFPKQRKINADAPSDTVPNAKRKPPQKHFYVSPDGTFISPISRNIDSHLNRSVSLSAFVGRSS